VLGRENIILNLQQLSEIIKKWFIFGARLFAKFFRISWSTSLHFKFWIFLIMCFRQWKSRVRYVYAQNVKGSTVLFTALLKKCIEKGVVAICRYSMRKNTPPRFAALFPQVWKAPVLYNFFSCNFLWKIFYELAFGIWDVASICWSWKNWRIHGWQHASDVAQSCLESVLPDCAWSVVK
jgi:Ku70/Ku80 beta-barrel domain